MRQTHDTLSCASPWNIHQHFSQAKDLFNPHFKIRLLEWLANKRITIAAGGERQQFYEIFCITKGRGELTVDVNKYSFTDGKVFFLFPGQSGTIQTMSPIDGYHISASVDFVYLSQIMQ